MATAVRVHYGARVQAVATARISTVAGLITQLIERREERQLERLCQQLERHDLPVLDELGYIPCTKAGADMLFEVVSRAYEWTSLLVTTNLPFENWTEVLGIERLTWIAESEEGTSFRVWLFAVARFQMFTETTRLRWLAAAVLVWSDSVRTPVLHGSESTATMGDREDRPASPIRGTPGRSARSPCEELERLPQKESSLCRRLGRH